METRKWIYLLIMALTTYLIRVLPLTLIRKKITNRYLQSFLYYLPYVTLTVMTFPAIMDATANPLVGLLSMAAAVLAAIFGAGLLPISLIACLVVFGLEFII